MTWWNEKASELLDHVSLTEQEHNQRHFGPEEDEAKQAVKHIRQDVVLIFSLLSSANQQLRTIKFLLGGLLAVLILIAINK